MNLMPTRTVIKEYRGEKEKRDSAVARIIKEFPQQFDIHGYVIIPKLTDQSDKHQALATYKYIVPENFLDSVVIALEENSDDEKIITVLEMERNLETLDKKCQEAFADIKALSAATTYGTSLAKIKMLFEVLEKCFDKQKTFCSIMWEREDD